MGSTPIVPPPPTLRALELAPSTLHLPPASSVDCDESHFCAWCVNGLLASVPCLAPWLCAMHMLSFMGCDDWWAVCCVACATNGGDVARTGTGRQVRVGSIQIHSSTISGGSRFRLRARTRRDVPRTSMYTHRASIGFYTSTAVISGRWAHTLASHARTA